MKLTYYESANFGDALNPRIFKHYLPDFFDQNSDIQFLGIGSILGFGETQTAPKKVVFSSGYAYGSIPTLDDTYDIFCVRGPKTCEALNIDKSLAVVDGAMLLRNMEVNNEEKKYKFSFMPHWESELKFDWRKIAEQSGINYISPTEDPETVLKKIKQSEVVIAEAMHAAIVADALRVPWIPVRSYKGINNFKWTDWCSSLEMNYSPFQVGSYYHNTDFMREVIRGKMKVKIPNGLLSGVLSSYEVYQSAFLINKLVDKMEHIKTLEPQLSRSNILDSKVEQLLEKFELLKKKY
ncbi:polysaccharide pyruvyl transferase family protein [Fulvivirga sediminis]|uniref:Polysaccharide pyruvyl transferase family protein n=1 Tax=Fulvivirga sediminis TaxID=2803949 RepID=A0A937FBL1_9BACT|nr:polysaccharide pyruvyl transferase family protein [Fulvivirga sediminis]MBL3658184.1 polysaccharide pyruvyl transferase family protein [Fulvivirga sediminis]